MKFRWLWGSEGRWDERRGRNGVIQIEQKGGGGGVGGGWEERDGDGQSKVLPVENQSCALFAHFKSQTERKGE